MNQDNLYQFAAQLRHCDEPRSDCPGASDDDFNERAWQLFELQFDLNPAYHSWCQRLRRRPSAPFRWRDLPALPVEAFKEFEVSCLSKSEQTTEFRSSGTTGHRPSRHFHHADSLSLYEWSALRGFTSRWSSERAPLLFSLTPPLAEAPHSSLVHMVDWVLRDFGLPGSGFFGRNDPEGWQVETSKLEQRLRACLKTPRGAVFKQALRETTNPLLLVGTAFNFVHFLDSMPNEEAIRLPAGSQIMETGGYKGRSRELPRSELHSKLAQRFALPHAAIFTEYGMCELSSQAYSEPSTSDSLGPILKFPAWARSLVVSPETGREVAEGEVGLLRVVDLANVWSVLALQTADLAIRRGAHFELLGRAPTAEARGCSLMSVNTH